MNKYILSFEQLNEFFFEDDDKFELFIDNVLVCSCGYRIIDGDHDIKEIDGPFVSLHSMNTLEKFQRKGYAKNLLENIFKYVKNDLKIDTIVLGVMANNHNAISLYKSVGFEELHREPGAVHFQMIKRL